VDDRAVKGSGVVEWQSPRFGVRLFAQRDYREAGDVRERSGVVNSVAAQEFGSDYTDPFQVQGGGVGLDARGIFGGRFRLDASWERQRALVIRATPSQGHFPRILPATPLRAVRLSLSGDRATSLGPFGTEIRLRGELRASRLRTDDMSVPVPATSVGRAFASVDVERPIGRNRLAIETSGGVVGANGDIPPQEWLYFGGPVSAPGYDFHELASRVGVTSRLEWRTPVPVPGIPLGRFGKVPGEATLAPFVQGTFIRRALDADLAHPTGVYPSAGIALQPFFDLLRLQLTRGLRNGRWTFDVDISREFWDIL
jgi:hypothetical protein